MSEWWSTIRSELSRRLLFTVGGSLALLLLVTVCVVANSEADRDWAARQRALDHSANLFAGMLSARLAAAGEVARSLAAADPGKDAQTLLARVKNARVFTGVILLNIDSDGIASASTYQFHFSRAQMGTLLSGGSALVSMPLDTGLPSLFLVRPVSIAGTSQVAAFALAPDWLWGPLADLPEGFILAAVDGRGAVIYGAEAAPDLARLAGKGFGDSLRGTINHHLSWQSRGAAWDGSLTELDMGESATSAPIAVVVASRQPSFWSHLTTLGAGLPLLLAVAIAAAMWTTLAVAGRYSPALRALREAFQALANQRLCTLPAPVEADLREVYEAYNNAIFAVGRQLATLRAQSDIDELLLGAAELEAVIDPVLLKLRDLMNARAVGLTLVDADAPGYGRLFASSSDDMERPVSRVALDPEVLEVFARAPEGLTIVRCEEGRHSFLMPLARVGAQVFWAWPVFANEALVAILSVGYGEAPRLEARLANHGTDCARRLGTVLSRGARAEQLYRQAHYDPLTQLPNRLLFRDRLDQAISTATSTATRGALLYIDLDHFKRINDGLGHAAGDQLLTIVGQRLRACVKEGDTVARLAGDEFTIILQQVSDPDVARHVVRRVIETLQLPVNLGGRDHKVFASVGITLFPDDGANIEELMRNADLAMYRAKDRGRGAAVFFDRGLMTRQPAAQEKGLHGALRRREFSLFFQPQYRVADGSLYGVEALLRWDSPRGGLRQPAEFVPAAEECGLIIDIGGWVIEAACAQLAAWRNQALPVPRMAVNISLQQLRDLGFVALVKRLLEKYALASDMLEFELGQSAFTDPGAIESIQGLVRLGVGLVLEDFGQGYSALEHLRRYPVRAVKIDRSIVEKLSEDAAAATMAETIIGMACELGRVVVAEGVETHEQLDFLRELRCEVVQGYYLARPLAASGMSELLAARQASAIPDRTVATG